MWPIVDPVVPLEVIVNDVNSGPAVSVPSVDWSETVSEPVKPALPSYSSVFSAESISLTVPVRVTLPVLRPVNPVSPAVPKLSTPCCAVSVVVTISFVLLSVTENPDSGCGTFSAAESGPGGTASVSCWPGPEVPTLIVVNSGPAVSVPSLDSRETVSAPLKPGLPSYSSVFSAESISLTVPVRVALPVLRPVNPVSPAVPKLSTPCCAVSVVVTLSVVLVSLTEKPGIGDGVFCGAPSDPGAASVNC